MHATIGIWHRGRGREILSFAPIILAVVLGGSCVAADTVTPPVPPCAGALPYPTYGPIGGPPNVRTWSDGRLADIRSLGACLGWTEGEFRTLVATAGTFRESGGSAEILAGVGSVSSLLLVRYWSTTDHGWLPLVTAATALTSADNGQARADFTATELASGRDLIMSQRDNRSASDVIYRMRVRESTDERIVIETENVTPVRWWAVTLFPPGALRSVYYLEQRSPDIWSYYALTKVAGGSWLVAGHEKSYINRVVALYRHLAGIPTDLEPPAAP